MFSCQDGLIWFDMDMEQSGIQITTAFRPLLSRLLAIFGNNNFTWQLKLYGFQEIGSTRLVKTSFKIDHISNHVPKLKLQSGFLECFFVCLFKRQWSFWTRFKKFSLEVSENPSFRQPEFKLVFEYHFGPPLF